MHRSIRSFSSIPHRFPRATDGHLTVGHAHVVRNFNSFIVNDNTKQFKLSLIRKLVPNTIMLYLNWIANATDDVSIISAIITLNRHFE